MRQRVISSVAVVIVAVVPLVLGGPVFGALMIALGLLGFIEFQQLGQRLGGANLRRNDVAGVIVIAGFGLAALAGAGTPVVGALVTVAVIAPLALALREPTDATAVVSSSLSSLGMLYLSVPVFAAISLRELAGPVSQQWLLGLADATALAWPAAARGLAWTALVVFSIWVGDSVAYLAGRSLGRRPMAPRISPKKTVEGALAGLVGSAVTAWLCDVLFGLGLPPGTALALGFGLGVVGQAGDLIESLLKRQADVKDSGALIPGHGGILDRIDALLLTFPVAWIVALLIDGAPL